jgi:hypothetical protein
LPEISAALPSELYSSIAPSASASFGSSTSIQPSAPIPVWRWQIACAIAG